MAYRHSKKRRKMWSERANTKQDAIRGQNQEAPPDEVDRYLRIEISRPGTGEQAVFECFEGDRIDNYRVYCNGEYRGVQGITTLTNNIRKALPGFRRI